MTPQRPDPVEQHRFDMQSLTMRVIEGAQAGTIILTPLEHGAAQAAGILKPGAAVCDEHGGLIPLDEIPIVLLTPDGPT